MRISNDQGELYCTRGKHWADPENFSLDTRAKTGRSSWCRACTADHRRLRRAEQREAGEVRRAEQKTEELRQLAERKKRQPIF